MHSSRSSSGCSRLPVVVKVFQSLNPLPDHESQGLQQQFQQAYSDTQQVKRIAFIQDGHQETADQKVNS
ncbi:hypothetical protein PoMZ_04874 [Pyricularia oryzae]|uniref:Uncharacterized protein n=1 Tax=Pyricularia oryzae TaxID=318829 RepID=A0A4P7NDF7_PYROR|nr:hypothetical protein PoMZ_04874 [Pyricularia oryzae]